MRSVDRFMEPPDSGIMTDMLWSDPQRMPGRSPSKRGVGVQFGPDVTKRFLDANNLKMLIRSHECKDRGYEVRKPAPALSDSRYSASLFRSFLRYFFYCLNSSTA